MRTTIDIDDPILQELKARANRERKSLGRLVSDLLARAMSAGEGEPAVKIAALDAWNAKSMGARVDLADSEALYAALEDESREVAARVAEE